MPNHKQLFEVTNYDVESLFIVTTIKRGIREKDCNIVKQRFEDWLERTDRLCCEENFPDHTGGHVQTCHTMTIEQYWELMHTDQIKFDLYEYIVCNLMLLDNPFKSVTRIKLDSTVLIAEEYFN